MATGMDENAAELQDQSPPSGEGERRIPLSRLDTHRDQRIAWDKEEDEKTASDSLQKMSAAFSSLIESVGERPEREGLRRTPLRAAKALCFFTKGYEDNLTSKKLRAQPLDW